jgi:hypothetical protein
MGSVERGIFSARPESRNSSTNHERVHTMIDQSIRRRRFALGQIVSTPGALQAFDKAGPTPLEFLARHAGGDCGEISQDDFQENELSVQQGFRVLSAYKLKTGVRIWIITEADRSSTCILLPEEY